MNRALLPLAVMLVAGSLGPTAAQARKLYPVDEAGKDPSFQAFRRRLVAALRRGDRTFVLGVVDPKIEWSFGDGPGIQGFRKAWKLDEAGSVGWNSLRDTLLSTLALGGSFDKGEFCAPYVFSRWPADLDSFEHAAVLGRQVAVRSGPSATAPILTRLTHDIVKIPPPGKGDAAWVKIITPGGRRGYVAARDLRGPTDYRACFKRVKGNWRMTVFVAGD